MSETEQVQEQQVEAAPAAEKSPEVAYEFEKPEGYELPDSRLDEIASYARERGLSKEQAQEILVREHTAQQAYKTAEFEKFAQTRQQWVEELKNDKVYGGDKFNATVDHAKRALAKFAPPSLVEVLNRTGLGDHKDLIITFARVYEMMSEDSLITRNAGSAPAPKKDIADILYGG